MFEYRLAEKKVYGAIKSLENPRLTYQGVLGAVNEVKEALNIAKAGAANHNKIEELWGLENLYRQVVNVENDLKKNKKLYEKHIPEIAKQVRAFLEEIVYKNIINLEQDLAQTCKSLEISHIS